MTEHTKLPWHHSRKSVYVSDINHNCIAQMILGQDENEANADFIVKAVNSFEETQGLLTDIWFHFSATDDPTLRSIADRARAILDPVSTPSGGGK